jgi:hypothetical protein
LFDDGLPRIEIPDITLIRNADRDGLARIDDTSAADGKDSGDALGTAELDALPDGGQGGIRLDTAEFRKIHAGLFQ